MLAGGVDDAVDRADDATIDLFWANPIAVGAIEWAGADLHAFEMLFGGNDELDRLGFIGGE